MTKTRKLGECEPVSNQNALLVFEGHGVHYQERSWSETCGLVDATGFLKLSWP